MKLMAKTNNIYYDAIRILLLNGFEVERNRKRLYKTKQDKKRKEKYVILFFDHNAELLFSKEEEFTDVDSAVNRFIEITMRSEVTKP